MKTSQKYPYMTNTLIKRKINNSKFIFFFFLFFFFLIEFNILYSQQKYLGSNYFLPKYV